MQLDDFCMRLQEALSKNHSIVFNCRCTIDYSGRAESHLPIGDRILIIKEDKTLICHQHRGSNPVNHMRENTLHSIIRQDDHVSIQSRRIAEFMDIVVKKVYFFHSQSLDDGEKIRVAGTEEDMARHILQNPQLISKDFKPLSKEEHTKNGFIDVFGYDKESNLVVVECKRSKGDLAAVTQLRRYVEKIKETKGLEKVKGVLACPRISPNALAMLKHWGFEFAEVNPPNYLERAGKHQTKLTFQGS